MPEVTPSIAQSSTPRSSGSTPADSFAVNAPQITLPKGGGAVRGIGETFSANPVTGTASFSVPLAVAPGRLGFAPELSLSYDSGAGNGPFGLGMRLSTSSIARRTDRGIPQYRDAEESDVFVLAGADDLVPVLRQDPDGSWVAKHAGFSRDAAGWVSDLNGKPAIHEDLINGYRVRRYRPRIEGLFSRIERWTHSTDATDVYWRGTSRDNVTTLYGTTSASRISDPADSRHIFSWLIAERYDDKGNSLLYGYGAEDDTNVTSNVGERHRVRTANRYLRSVKYGNTPSRLSPNFQRDLKWRFELQFEYGDGHYSEGDYREDAPIPNGNTYVYVKTAALHDMNWPARMDPHSSYRSGFEVRTHRLCHRVLLFHRFDELLGDEPQLVRATEIKYDDDPILTRAASITHASYVPTGQRANGERQYLKRVLPPLELSYTLPVIDETVRDVDEGSIENLPRGLDGSEYEWIDLDRQGLSGVLTEQNGAWYLKRNLAPTNLEIDASGRRRARAKFAPLARVGSRPNAALGTGGAQFLDLASDGQLDVVILDGPTPGFYRLGDAEWENFRAFTSHVNRDFRDPNLRMIDLDGDGLADVLITEDEVLTWHRSLGEDGFGSAQHVPKARDEAEGPALVFADGTESIFLADLTGDGLVDLVRVRNGQVCYWPNRGYGTFAAQVTMAASPWFDAPDLFDPRRIRLADVNGSGCTDIVYLHSDGARIYFNESGNGWSPASGRELPSFPRADQLSSVRLVDLLGNGTACLVWSTSLPDRCSVMRYVDLMSGEKPHLLCRVRNNLGATTDIEYTPSTRFYLQDALAGKRWATRLHFPVHCMSKVIVTDKWRNTRFASTYSYHSGYYDSPEREFRGFGRVEQIDCESYGTFAAGNINSPYITANQHLYQPPVKTITWFHTGAFLDQRRILAQYAHEYFPTALVDDNAALQAALGGFTEHALAEPDLAGLDLSAEEWREALRACKGMALRQEIYELDVDDLTVGKETPVKIFSATNHSARINRLQPRANQRHAVFLVTESESLGVQYELDLRAPQSVDPRISHTLTLTVDALGQPLQSVAIGYPRLQTFVDRQNLFTAPQVQTIRDVQAQLHVAYTETRYTNQDIDDADHYRLRLPCEVATYELTGIVPRNSRAFSIDELRGYWLSDRYQTAGTVVFPIDYHVQPDGSAQRRLVSLLRTLYFDDAGSGAPPSQPLGFAQHGPRGLKYEDYKLAMTDALLDAVVGNRLDDAVVGAQKVRTILADPSLSGYASGQLLQSRFSPPVPQAALAGQYWLRSGTAGFGAEAQLHFFVPQQFTDAFGNQTRLTLDAYDLVPKSSEDARGNTTQVLEFDYRALAPRVLQDANANVTRLAFDVLGLPAAVALERGGDTVTAIGFDLLNPGIKDRASFFSLDPYSDAQPRAWLANATTRFIYYFGETLAADGTIAGWESHPGAACTIQRETHVSQLAGASTNIQVAVEYSDGAGQVLLKAVQAEPDPGDARAVHPLRWIVNGKTALNNKRKPVKQYEPYFSLSEHRFDSIEAIREVGVTPILYYDAPGRLIRTEQPDHTVVRVEFSPWLTLSFDANDTVLDSQWYASRGSPDPAGPMPAAADQRAAWLAARHADTPMQVHRDSLGREVVAVAHNREFDANGAPQDAFHVTFTKLDAEGKPLWIRDARGNLVMQYIVPAKATAWADDPNEDVSADAAPCYDMRGQLLHQQSTDAGERWMLMDALGKPLAAWDRNERQSGAAFAIEQRLYYTEYDALHRPQAVWLRIDAGARVMAERFEYRDTKNPDGSANPNLAADQAANLIGQAGLHYDAGGRTELVRRDFKGNTLETARRLNNLPMQSLIDWQTGPDGSLETEEFRRLSEFDALNRITLVYNWHRGAGSRVAVYQPKYNQRGLLLSESLTVRAQKIAGGADLTAGTTVNAIEEIRYNAKGQRIYLARGRKAGVALGQGALTEYDYDPQTFKLRQIFTTRPDNARPAANRHAQLADAGVVQDLSFTFDPVGNVVECEDEAYEPVFFQNQQVEPRSQYEYDALYRLTRATGREHRGLDDAPENIEGPWLGADFPIASGDPDAMRNYTQTFRYDAAGNLERMRHAADSGGWTRRFHVDDDSNRLLDSWNSDDEWAQVNPADVVHYQFDTHGNTRNLNATPPQFNLRWDHRDMIESIFLGGGGTAYYQYDSAKQRTRKRIVSAVGTGYWERIDLGGYELYRRYLAANSATPLEEIDSLHLMEGGQRLLLVDDVIRTDRTHADGTAYKKAPLFRFQFSNHLGSANLELDDLGAIISYEEFHPYGTSAFRAMRRDTEAPAKRYRYTGMERDEESGLSYHTARYYTAWLARWVSCDPAGLADGVNLFAYARGNPLNGVDKAGTHKTPPTEIEFAESEGESFTPIRTSADAADVVASLPLGDRPVYEFFNAKYHSLVTQEGVAKARNVREAGARLSNTVLAIALAPAAILEIGVALLPAALDLSGASLTALLGYGRGLLIGIDLTVKTLLTTGSVSSALLAAASSSELVVAGEVVVGAALNPLPIDPTGASGLVAAEVKSGVQEIVAADKQVFASSAGNVIVDDAALAKGTYELAADSAGATASNLAGPVLAHRPINPGESAFAYGDASHDVGLQRFIDLTDPVNAADYFLNTQRGVTGPDVWPLGSQNYVIGELKPIWYRQSTLLQQIRNWGADPQQTRLFFYDRQGFFFEGVFTDL